MELEDLKYVKSGAARFFGKIYLLPYLGRKHPNWPNVEVFSNISKQIVVIFCRKWSEIKKHKILINSTNLMSERIPCFQDIIKHPMC